jgi:hypothetical protein
MSLSFAVLALVGAPASVDGGDTSVAESTSSFLSGFFDAIGNNGYQTGTAAIAATIALVAMANIRTNGFIAAGVAAGAFWAGWLGWNSVTGNDNALFSGDVQATQLWDVAFTSDRGFLFVAIVGCVLAYFLWRKSLSLVTRLVLFVGGILGASLLYNVYESLRATA